MKMKIIIFAVFVVGSISVAALLSEPIKTKDSCLKIYFDSETSQQVSSGRAFAEKLAEILRPYKDYQAQLEKIENYKSGDLQACTKNIYIGTHFENRVPRSFVEDLLKSQGNFVWFGYNIWQMGPRLEREWGLRFIRMTQSASSQDRGFDEIVYQGGTFRKTEKTSYKAQVELLPSDPSRFVTLAESRSSVSREIIPYAIQAKKHFYVADVPELKLATDYMRLMLAEILARFIEEAPMERAPAGI